MRPNNYRLNSRASSATLSLRQQQLDVAGAFAEDSSIAQELLRGQKIPTRNASLRAFPSNSNLVPVHHHGDGTFDTEGRNIIPDSEGPNRIRRGLCSSNTWTSSSGGISEIDDTDDRTRFVDEFNRLAEKHGVRTFMPSEYETAPYSEDVLDKHGSWLSRKIFRRTSSPHTVRSKKELRHLRNKRSISDSLRMMGKRDSLKDRDLMELVRLCGSSLLYLPAEYASSSLALPTCLRATAQYLIQHAPATRGIFRIPGSQSTINTLYNHYCATDDEGGLIAGTVRCPTLPEHIQCDVHDVASAFKKFLSGIPGGILGSLPLFDALVSIQTHLRGDPELTRTKHSKVRARLIALSIATLRSTYRRDLICAVFGLLCMIGRAAEITRREDDRGRPLPTSDLMGYRPLSIVFGPLLAGDLLENYNLRLVDGRGSLVLTPISPPKHKKEKHKKHKSVEEGITFHTTVDKVKVAISITEMLITHWRDIVRHMKNLDALKTVDGYKSLLVRGRRTPILRPSMSEAFSLRKPPDWVYEKSNKYVDRSQSPTPPQRRFSPHTNTVHTGSFSDHKRATEELVSGEAAQSPLDHIDVRKQRSRQQRPPSGKVLTNARSGSTLSPAMVEEHPDENSFETDKKSGYSQTPNHKYNTSAKPTIPPPSKVKDTETAPVTKHSVGPRVKGIVKRLESETDEQSIPSPKSDAKDFGTKKGQNAQDKPSKESKPLKSSTPLYSSKPKAPQPSPPPRSSQSPSKDHYSHIRFEPINHAGPSTQSSTQGIESGTISPRRKRFTDTSGSKHSIVTDPLSRVSQEEDIASLAMLAEALDSPRKYKDLTEKSEKSQQPAKHDSGVDFQSSLEKENKKSTTQLESSRPQSSRHSTSDSRGSKNTREKSNSEGFHMKKGESTVPITTKSIEPVATQARGKSPRQNATPATLSKVASIREKFRPRKSPETSVSQNGPIAESPKRNQSIPEPVTPKKMSVKAMADRFNAVTTTPLRPNPSPPPHGSISPTKSVYPAPTKYADTHKDGGVVSPYTINPPPSPSRSIASIRSEKSVRSFRNAVLAARFQQAQTQSSPTKSPAPRRVLREFVPDSSLRQASGEEPSNSSDISNTRALSASNSLSVPLKAVEHPASKAGLDGAYSSIGSSETLSPTSSEVEAAQFFLSQLQHNIQNDDDIPVRHNSILHKQIRNLQKQVYEKTEALVHLQRQIEVRSASSDVGGLNEQLREAREEIEIWRRRAEGAERKLEVLEVMSGERRGLGGGVKRWMGVGGGASTSEGVQGRGYSEDGGVGVRKRWGAAGMDGAMSSEGSEGSNGTTVVRERSHHGRSGNGENGRGSIEGGVRHNDWAKQTLNIMGGLGGWDR